MKTTLLLACLILLLTACAASRYQDRPQQLETRILVDGSKQFVYRVHLASAAVGPSLDGRHNHRQQRPVPSRQDYARLQNRTANVVARTGFCREGYLQLDYRLSPTVQWIRGECREDASEDDIARFGQQGTVALENIDR